MKIQMKHIQLQNCPRTRTGFKGASFRVLACLMMFISFSAFAQKNNVSGVVVDKNTNEPVAGAALMVKGTSTGTVTNPDGTYTVKAGDNDVLVCQFFGYKTQEVNVAGRAKIDIVLEEDVETLEATVVVGYGTLKKTQLVGSVENLDGEKVADRPNANVARSLQGQVAGLNIIQTDGKASHSGQIFIRGNRTSGIQTRAKAGGNAENKTYSFGTGGSALVLIDGVEGDLGMVNPSDIETVSVLKDASSAAIYGARGANGVILVTTKDGGSEKFTVSYSGSYQLNTRSVRFEDEIIDDGLEWTENFYEFWQGRYATPQNPTKIPTAINTLSISGAPKDYLQMFREKRAAGVTDPYDFKTNGEYLYFGNTNWPSLFFKKNHSSQTHDITVRGGSKKLQYSLTGRFYDSEGLYKIGEDFYRTFNLRSKVKAQVFNWLSIDNNTALFHSRQSQSMFSTGDTIFDQMDHHGQAPLTPTNADGTYTNSGVRSGYAQFIEGNGQWDRNLTVTSTTGLTIDFIKDVLKLRADFSYKAIRRGRERARVPVTAWLGPASPFEYDTHDDSYKSYWTYDTDYMSANAVLTWTPKLGENHNLNVVGGWNLEDSKYRRFYTTRSGMSFPDNFASFELFDGTDIKLEQNNSDYGLVGFFGRVNYSLFNRYIFEVSARYDGSSKFPTSQQWGFFPSASVGWRVDQEPWMKWSKNWLDNFKLRGNFGSLGNGAISPYTFMELMEVNVTSVPFNGVAVNYTTVPTPVPSSLTWETITTYDIGLDADFLKSRLSFSGDYYWKHTTDIITNGPDLPNLYGASSPKGNYAAMLTKGWEVTLSWRDAVKLGNHDFNYSIKGSLWDTRSWVADYPETDGNIYQLYKGKEIGEMWGLRTNGYFQSNIEALQHASANGWITNTYNDATPLLAGDLKIIDMDGDGTINYGKGTLEDHGDLDRIGNVTPRLLYGLNLDFTWNGIGLSMFFQGIGKRDWYPALDSALFWGAYNRTFTGWQQHTHNDYAKVEYFNADGSVNEDWVVTNFNERPYWVRRVGHSAQRTNAAQGLENDYFLQNAAYIRLKNLTVDYTLPQNLTQKAKIEKIRFYVSMENLWTWSPIYKHTQMFDPEGIYPGDSDFDTVKYGQNGAGDGSGYPMLKTFTFGVNLTF